MDTYHRNIPYADWFDYSTKKFIINKTMSKEKIKEILMDKVFWFCLGIIVGSLFTIFNLTVECIKKL